MKLIEGGVIGNPEDWDSADIRRRRAEDRARQEEAELQAAEEFQAYCDKMEATIAKYLNAELAEENAETRLTERQRADFELFRTYCDRGGWPALPTVPPALVSFLIHEMNNGDDVRTTRLCNSNSAVHRAVGLDSDPARDVLCRAFFEVGAQRQISTSRTREGIGLMTTKVGGFSRPSA
jgi:hypothetical protein